MDYGTTEDLFELVNGTYEVTHTSVSRKTAIMINAGTATIQPFAYDDFKRKYNIEGAVAVGNGKVLYSEVPIDGIVVTAAAGKTADSKIRVTRY